MAAIYKRVAAKIPIHILRDLGIPITTAAAAAVVATPRRLSFKISHSSEKERDRSKLTTDLYILSPRQKHGNSLPAMTYLFFLET